jgi:hypothetical protein
MTAFFIGVLGAFAVVAPLCIGAIMGWKAHAAYTAHLEALQPPPPEQEPPSAEQMRRFMEDQEAFEAMLHYSPETAYGLTGDPLRDIAGKE